MPRRRRRSESRQREQRAQPTTTPIDAPSGWIAQRYHSRDSGPDYVCPRCERPVSRSSQHVVAWRTDEDDTHRHWHTGCWESAVREGIERYRWT
ncbi:MAG: hypothetical protein WD646_11845 [Actinomycetota bacterium]